MTDNPDLDAEQARRAAHKDAVAKMKGAREAMALALARIEDLEGALKRSDAVMKTMLDQIGPSVHFKVYRNGNLMLKPALEIITDARANIAAAL